MIREIVAVMRDHLKIHLIAMIGIILLTVAFTGWIVPAMVIPNGSQRSRFPQYFQFLFLNEKNQLDFLTNDKI